MGPFWDHFNSKYIKTAQNRSKQIETNQEWKPEEFQALSPYPDGSQWIAIEPLIGRVVLSHQTGVRFPVPLPTSVEVGAEGHQGASAPLSPYRPDSVTIRYNRPSQAY